MKIYVKWKREKENKSKLENIRLNFDNTNLNYNNTSLNFDNTS